MLLFSVLFSVSVLFQQENTILDSDIIINFKDGVNFEQMDSILAKHNLVFKSIVWRNYILVGQKIDMYDTQQNRQLVQQTIAQLNQDTIYIKSASENFEIPVPGNFDSPSEPNYNLQWNMKSTIHNPDGNKYDLSYRSMIDQLLNENLQTENIETIGNGITLSEPDFHGMLYQINDENIRNKIDDDNELVDDYNGFVLPFNNYPGNVSNICSYGQNVNGVARVMVARINKNIGIAGIFTNSRLLRINYSLEKLPDPNLPPFPTNQITVFSVNYIHTIKKT